MNIKNPLGVLKSEQLEDDAPRGMNLDGELVQRGGEVTGSRALGQVYSIVWKQGSVSGERIAPAGPSSV